MTTRRRSRWPGGRPPSGPAGAPVPRVREQLAQLAVDGPVLVGLDTPSPMNGGLRAPSSSPTPRDIDAGQWADRTLPPGAVLAMGHWAGTLDVSTHHPVVQLEGLVGSPAYLDALRAGTVPRYLAGLGVTHDARLLHPDEAPNCRLSEPWFGRGHGDHRSSSERVQGTDVAPSRQGWDRIILTCGFHRRPREALDPQARKAPGDLGG